MSEQDFKKNRVRCIAKIGAWPFESKRVYESDGGSLVWRSRQHRRQLAAISAVDLGHNRTLDQWSLKLKRLNLWIGGLFALGSALFMLASVFSLVPGIINFSPHAFSVNAIFFAGSIPFTVAAWLQLFQAANTGSFPFTVESQQRRLIFGWNPNNIGWLGSALQFVGTLLFNLSTFDAISPSINWFRQDLLIWAPNIAGSILFLISGYLAFVEVCHRYWRWKPKQLSWWIVLINLAGCIGFIFSAILAIVLPHSSNLLVTTLSLMFTLQGSICFLVGALLSLREDLYAY